MDSNFRWNTPTGIAERLRILRNPANQLLSGNRPQSDWEKVVIYHTNPWSNGTDGDGISDNVDHF